MFKSIIIVLIGCILVLNATTIVGQNGVLVWMGLERTSENITSDLTEIETIHSILTSVAYERFNLGPNSTLILNNFTNVQSDINNVGLLTLPMISTCCPWGRPEVIEYARDLFLNPKPFISSAIEISILEGFNGFNVDIEPGSGDGTEQDAIDYANFIDQFANALHLNDKILTVAVATYTPFWNYTLLGNTAVDYLFTMSTYGGDIEQFTQNFQYAVNSIPLDKLAIGLMTVDGNNNPLSDQDLTQRFDLINAANIRYIGIWDAPIPSNWFPFLTEFSQRNQVNKISALLPGQQDY
ncbi:hypothetical protein DFA_10977 [Cavenderia fasciculata]|uniref:GH18 domain-containing protein n=1 Tax=Cavenderia fasciculata TaxID=261658 RepID=F4QBX9_CACFS|nr:uncharacterized protein DFA_10977 [Cavenderia fasciculata]EGG14717.1 hypothetical protein DFA_10977 [Cavenderia fasciculata]|eukprot:XP_004351225.1 hypothetical protein DFA_10977 [Cavenderia fasciculata]